MKHTLFFLCLLFLLCLRPIYGSVVTISVGENLLFDELLTTINHRLNESRLLDSIHSLNDRGNNFQAHFQYQSAVEAHFKAMEYAQASQDTSLLICTLNHIGTDLRLAGAPMQSARYHQQALALSKQVPYDVESRVNTMEQLGLVYLSLREYKRALTLFQTGYALVDSMHLETHRARGLYHIGTTHLGLNQVDTALCYYRESLARNRKKKCLSGIGMCKYSLGNIYLQQGKTQQGLVMMYEALDTLRMSKDLYNQLIVETSLLSTLLKLNKTDEASHFLSAMIDASLYNQSFNYHYLLLDLKVRLYKQQKKYRQALLVKEQVLNFRDSVMVNRDNLSILELLHQYEQQQLDNQISALEAQHDMVLQNRRYTRYLFMTICAFLLLLSIGSLYSYYIKRRLNKELMLLAKLKTRFFNNLSHELRTPLTLIQGPLEEIKKPHTEEQYKQFLNLARHNVRRLQFLVNQLLLLGKVDAHQFKVHIVPMDLAKQLTAITQNFQLYAQMEKHPYAVQLDETGLIYGDKEIIEIILSNLISNAFKYSPSDDEVVIKGKNQDTFYRLEVINKAPQITQEDIVHLFDRFYSLGGDFRTSTGIGLSVVHELAILYGSPISAVIDADHRIHFQIDIPFFDEQIACHKIPSTVDQSVQSATSPTKKVRSAASPEQIVPIEVDFSVENSHNHLDQLTVLVVEDDPDMRRYINMCFDGHFNVLEARDGLEGLTSAKANSPDLILSDIMMPRMSGLELCDALKKDLLTSHIPIILLTALTGDENELRALHAHANDFICKSFSAETLLNKVTNMLQTIAELKERFAKEIWIEPLQVSIHGGDDPFVELLEKVIHHDIFDPEFSVDRFCEIGGLSKSQLYRKIKSCIGCTPLEFIKQVRIKQASRLLKKSKKSISDIAFQCGFSDASYFSRVFKEWTGISPSEYREQH